MDGIANVARQQQSQISSAENQAVAAQSAPKPQSTTEVVKELAVEAQKSGTKINSEKDVKDLVNQLNKALAPLNPNIKFGVDSDDVFFVAVRESETDKLIRRFPAEQAHDFLPKMQEVSGILFDTKG